MKRYLLLALAAIAAAALLTAGCASTASIQSASSGEIGSKPSEIEISDYRLNMSASSWTAKCHDKIYYCSGTEEWQLKLFGCKQAQEK
jgi:hypothetical protein